MAELTIDPTTIRKALDEFVESYKPSDTPTQEVGYVATAGDGIGQKVAHALLGVELGQQTCLSGGHVTRPPWQARR